MANNIWVRSPYFFKIRGTTTAVTAQLKIKITSGGKPATWTGGEQYSLSGTMIDIGSGVTQINFEIAELIKDYLNPGFNPTSGSYRQDITNNYSNAWVDFQYILYNSSGGVISTTNDLGYMAWYGYLPYYLGSQSNQNGQRDDFTIMMSNRKILRPYGEKLIFAVNYDEVDRVEFYCKGELKYGVNLTSTTTQSQNFIRYVEATNTPNWISESSEDDAIIEENPASDHLLCAFDSDCVDSIWLSVGTVAQLIEVETIKTPRYKPVKVTFINSWGALQDVWMFGTTTNSMRAKATNYKRNLIENDQWGSNSDYYLTKHQQTILDKNGVRSWTLNTGFYPEENNIIFEELILSEFVWIDKQYLNEYYPPSIAYGEEHNKIPVTLTSNSLSFKTSNNNKLIQYTFSFENSFNIVQDIR